MIRILLAASSLILATNAVGALNYVECPNPLATNNPPYLGVPDSPADASQPILIGAGIDYYRPMEDLIIGIDGTTIDVTLVAKQYGGTPPPMACIGKTINGLPSGVYTVNLLLDEINTPGRAVLIKSKVLEVTGPPAELSGLWWNASEPGWGVNFTQRGNVVFAVWYTYDAGGAPKWYAAPRCELPRAAPAGRCVESIYEVNGPTFFKSAFDPNARRVDAVGTMTLDFATSDSGTMSTSIGGIQRTLAISRQPLKTGAPPAINYTDLWWNPDESGWGMGVTHQNDVMFITWFVYDNNGKSMWYVASNCDYVAATEACSGTLYRTVGPAMAKTFDSSKVHAIPVGSVSLRFLDSNNAVLEYTVDGVSSSKAIKRQVF